MIFSLLMFLVGCDDAQMLDVIYIEKCVNAQEAIYELIVEEGDDVDRDYYSECTALSRLETNKTKVDEIERFSCIIDEINGLEAMSNDSQEELNAIFDYCSYDL